MKNKLKVRPLASYSILREGAEAMRNSVRFSLDRAAGAADAIFCINPHSYEVAAHDPEFESALCSASVLVPDGIGVVWALRFLGLPTVERVSGPDVYKAVMEELSRRNGSAFYLGSSPETLSKLAASVALKYPNVRVAGVRSPSFSEMLSEEESQSIIDEVNELSPDVLWVGMTAPKQEKWLARYSVRLRVKIACAVGAVFDFEAGTVVRAPRVMQKAGLEWLFRSLVSPSRLGRRNATSNPRFVLRIVREKYLKSSKITATDK